MKTLLLTFVLLCIPTLSQAQDTETSFFMMNHHQCWPDEMDEVRAFSSAHLEPVLAELEEEGAIQEWGVLEHGWGDEWNWNFYIITESHAAFLEAWEQFFEKLEARRPNFYEDVVAPKCFAHKDNMYVVTAMSD